MPGFVTPLQTLPRKANNFSSIAISGCRYFRNTLSFNPYFVNSSSDLLSKVNISDVEVTIWSEDTYSFVTSDRWFGLHQGSTTKYPGKSCERGSSSSVIRISCS